MERESMVQEVSVEFDGETYTAAYILEGNTIHANLQGRILPFSVGNVAPASIVKAVFIGQLMHSARRPPLPRGGVSWNPTRQATFADPSGLSIIGTFVSAPSALRSCQAD